MFTSDARICPDARIYGKRKEIIEKGTGKEVCMMLTVGIGILMVVVIVDDVVVFGVLKDGG